MTAFDLENDEAVSYAAPVSARDFRMASLQPGQIGGVILDPSGAVIPGARVTVLHPDTGARMTATTDSEGRWVLSNVPSGRIHITAVSPGFHNYVQNTNYDAWRPLPLSLTMNVGTTTETVMVEAQSTSTLQLSPGIEKQARKRALEEERAASANVTNLQRRVSGVLPVAVDVPRAGNSYRFVRPLVLDEETKVTFTYKTK
jgi:hypothetical protein